MRLRATALFSSPPNHFLPPDRRRPRARARSLQPSHAGANDRCEPADPLETLRAERAPSAPHFARGEGRRRGGRRNERRSEDGRPARPRAPPSPGRRRKDRTGQRHSQTRARRPRPAHRVDDAARMLAIVSRLGVLGSLRPGAAAGRLDHLAHPCRPRRRQDPSRRRSGAPLGGDLPDRQPDRRDRRRRARHHDHRRIRQFSPAAGATSGRASSPPTCASNGRTAR